MNTAARQLMLGALIAVTHGCDAPPAAPPPPPPVSGPVQSEMAAPPPWPEGTPSPREIRAQQEIALHAALYRAAHQSNVGGLRHFVLDPVQEDQPPELDIEPEQFRTRVLDELADLHAPMAWKETDWREREQVYFPGTSERATFLSIHIRSRDADQATIIADIGDHTAGSESSRQTVVAAWDGRRWIITRQGLRLVW